MGLQFASIRLILSPFVQAAGKTPVCTASLAEWSMSAWLSMHDCDGHICWCEWGWGNTQHHTGLFWEASFACSKQFCVWQFWHRYLYSVPLQHVPKPVFQFYVSVVRILTHVSSVHSNGHHMVAMFNDSWQISLLFHRLSKSCRTSKAHIPSTMIKMNLYISGFGCHWTWCNCLISLHPLGYQSVCQTYPIPPSPVPRETRPLPKLCAALMLRLDRLHWVK